MSSDKALDLNGTLRRHLTGGMLHDMQGIVADQGRKKHRVELKLDSSSSARGGLQTAQNIRGTLLLCLQAQAQSQQCSDLLDVANWPQLPSCC